MRSKRRGDHRRDLDRLGGSPPPAFPNYDAGTSGPDAADALIEATVGAGETSRRQELATGAEINGDRLPVHG
jgi:hypothetical protein